MGPRDERNHRQFVRFRFAAEAHIILHVLVVHITTRRANRDRTCNRVIAYIINYFIATLLYSVNGYEIIVENVAVHHVHLHSLPVRKRST